VKRDGAVVSPAQWGTAVPVNPGEHRFEARAPGKKPWEASVVVRADAQTTDIAVPALEDAPPEPSAAPAPSVVPVAPATPAAEPARSPNRTWAIAAGGVGIVCIGVGAAFGLSASSKWHDADDACPGGHCTDAASVTRGRDAGRAADLSTAFFLVGGAGLVASAILFFVPTSSDAKRATWRVSPLLGRATGVAIGGTL
jgi:hypothetical protein